MQILSGMVLAWVFLYGVAAAYFLRLYVRRTREPFQIVFVFLCLALAVYSFGAARFYVAASTHEGFVWTCFQVSSAAVALALLFDFVLRFAGWRSRAARVLALVSYGIGAAYAVLTAWGLSYDPSRPAFKDIRVFGFHLHYWDCETTPIGASFLAYVVVVSIVSGVILLRAAARDRITLFPVAAGATAFLGTIVNDALLNAGVIRSIYSLEHGFLFLVLGLLYSMLARSDRLAAAVEERSRSLASVNLELEQAYSDLGRSYESLARTQEDLGRARRLADLGRLSASLAHEIRNPLAVLSNVASMLRRHTEECSKGGGPTGGVDPRALIEMVASEVDRLGRLVDDLLLFAGRERRSMTDAPVGDIADQAVRDATRALEDPARYDVEREYAQPPPRANVDFDRVCRAVVNLLSNAFQSMPDGGRITVVVRRGDEAGTVRIGVRDRGPGIPADVLPRVFEPFFSTKPSGTGLGLAIVRTIAEDHGGKAWMETGEGKGTTAWIELLA